MWNSKKALGLQILGYYGYGGYPPGGFLTSLLETWGRADWENKMRLGQGFPELEEALRTFHATSPEVYKLWLDTVEENH